MAGDILNPGPLSPPWWLLAILLALLVAAILGFGLLAT